MCCSSGRPSHRTSHACDSSSAPHVDITIGETGPIERLVTESVAGRRPQMLFLAFGAGARSIARQYLVSNTFKTADD